MEEEDSKEGLSKGGEEPIDEEDPEEDLKKDLEEDPKEDLEEDLEEDPGEDPKVDLEEDPEGLVWFIVFCVFMFWLLAITP